jgi:general secretion pathway protein G
MTALESYFVDNHNYPTALQGLAALRTAPANAKNWHGPYLQKELPNDPWGNPYIYRSPGRNGGYEIISYGADGVDGGEGENGDIYSWK